MLRVVQKALLVGGSFLSLSGAPDFASAGEAARCIDLLDAGSLQRNNYGSIPENNGYAIFSLEEEVEDFSYFVNRSCVTGGCFIKTRFGQIRISLAKVFEVKNYANPNLAVDASSGEFYVAADGDFVGSWRRVYLFAAQRPDDPKAWKMDYKLVEVGGKDIPEVVQKCLGKTN